MAQLGNIALVLGLGLAIYAALASVVGARRGIAELETSGRRGLYMSLVAALTAGGALIYSFVTNDFSIKYVFEHSSTTLDRALLWVAFYAGNEGSLLYIAIVLAGMGSLAVRCAPARFAPALPYTVTVLAAILVFYYIVMVVFANPFAPLGRMVTEGQGLNPLLEHPGMFSHPPMLMAGLTGISIPFAFAAGVLLAGRSGDDWIDMARVWSLVVWGILGVGLLLGAWWAYTILGWGGYWSWDPIENVALMPWLVMTAFIHSIMVQKRRGMFRMWNIALLNIAFGLSLLGTFINRGGAVVSVHSFASSVLGTVFLSFMVVAIVLSFALFLWRYPSLRSDRTMESFLSREASFLVNNFLLLAVAASVLWGVIFPLVADLAQNIEVTVAAPYFNRTAGPMLLAMLFVMGIGPLLPWRKTSGKSLRRWLVWPALGGALTAGILAILGVTQIWALVGFSVIAFAFSAVLEEWWRGTRVRMRAGDNFVTSWWKMLNANRPRHGGYIAHIAILALAVGIVGTQFFDTRTDVAINLGESAVLGNYRIEYTAVREDNRVDRQARWADMDVYSITPSAYATEFAQAEASGSNGFTVASGREGETFLGTIRPWHGFYFNFNQVSIRSGIRSTPVEDLYVIPRDFLEDGRISLAISINPLAMWLWIAGPIFVVGTVFSLWPHPALERERRASVAKPAKTKEHDLSPEAL